MKDRESTGEVKSCRDCGASRPEAFGEPHDQEVDRFVTLKHLFGIVLGMYSRDVAMKGNATSATIHGVDGRKQVRRQRFRRGRWMVVTHGTRQHNFVFR